MRSGQVGSDLLRDGSLPGGELERQDVVERRRQTVAPGRAGRSRTRGRRLPTGRQDQLHGRGLVEPESMPRGLGVVLRRREVDGAQRMIERGQSFLRPDHVRQRILDGVEVLEDRAGAPQDVPGLDARRRRIDGQEWQRTNRGVHGLTHSSTRPGRGVAARDQIGLVVVEHEVPGVTQTPVRAPVLHRAREHHPLVLLDGVLHTLSVEEGGLDVLPVAVDGDLEHADAALAAAGKELALVHPADHRDVIALVRVGGPQAAALRDVARRDVPEQVPDGDELERLLQGAGHTRLEHGAQPVVEMCHRAPCPVDPRTRRPSVDRVLGILSPGTVTGVRHAPPRPRFGLTGPWR